MPSRRAVLIGIDDYSVYSRSVGTGESFDLLGARADVQRMFRLVRRLGYAPENIRVLTTPKFESFEPGEEGAHFHEATGREILDAIDWLADGLAESDGVGFLSFAGHGGMLPDVGELLCPSDVQAPDMTNAVSLRETLQLLRGRSPAPGLTIVLDCCFSRPSDTTDSSVRALTPTPATLPPAFSDDRVIVGAPIGGVAYEKRFDGRYCGVLSWALSQILGQVEVISFESGVGFGTNFSTLATDLRGMCDALHIRQAPCLLGGGRSDDAVGGPAGARVDATTSTQNGHPLEIWPGNDGFTAMSFPTTNGTGYLTLWASGTPPSGQSAWFVSGSEAWWLASGDTLLDKFQLTTIPPGQLPSSTTGFVAQTRTQEGFTSTKQTVDANGGLLYEVENVVGYASATSSSTAPSFWWNVIDPSYRIGLNSPTIKLKRLQPAPTNIQAYPEQS